MKKLYVLIFLLGIVVSANAQNIVQITQNNGSNNITKTHENCGGFKINGICSCEDIGGVDAEVFFEAGFYLRLTNYNQFPVTVLWKADYNRGDDDKTGTTVIGASGTNNSKKIVKLHDGRLGRWTLVGIITRKLKN